MDALALKSLLFLGGFLAWACWEHWKPYREGVAALWQRRAKNLAFGVISFIISRWWIIPVTLYAQSFSLKLAFGGPSWFDFLVNILILDLFLYVWHRLNHEVPLLWRFHRVHHLDEHLDTTTALRFHPGELLFSPLFRIIPIFLFDIPIETVLVYEGLIGLCALFHHSNINLPEHWNRWLSFVFITPQLHWVHHHKKKKDTDSNYGTIFILWDRLFGSWNTRTRTQDMPLGVEGVTGPDPDFKELLLLPLTRTGK